MLLIGRYALAAAMVAMGISLAATSAQSAEIIVFSTISAKEALIELVPEFERASGHKVNITYAGGSGLSKQILGGKLGDLFIGPEEFSGPLMKEGKLLAGSRIDFARSRTGLAVRAGVAKPDISSPEKLKSVLLASRSGVCTARAQAACISSRCSNGLASPKRWRISGCRRVRASWSGRWSREATRTSRYNKSVNCCRCKVSRFSIRCRRNFSKPSLTAPLLFHNQRKGR